MARDFLDPAVQSLITRCRLIDWCRPQHGPRRAASAYERWLRLLGIKRHVIWISDPADVPEWQAEAAGVVSAWGAVAASNPASSVVIGLLDDAAAAGRWAPPVGDVLVAANWAFAVNLHLATVAGGADHWFGAWRELVARDQARALAMVLLSPPFLWPAPAPAMIALTAPGALSACADKRVWDTFAAAVAGVRRSPWKAPPLAPPLSMPTAAEVMEALVTLAEPMIEACEAGAFAHALRGDEILVLAAPALWTEGGRLHRPDGPALVWPRTRAGAWHGFLLPDGFVVADGALAPAAVSAVTGPLQDTLMDVCARGYRIHGASAPQAERDGLEELRAEGAVGFGPVS